MTKSVRFLKNCPIWARESISRSVKDHGYNIRVGEDRLTIETRELDPRKRPEDLLPALGTDARAREVWDQLKTPFDVEELTSACWGALSTSDRLTPRGRRELAAYISGLTGPLAAELRTRSRFEDWQHHFRDKLTDRLYAINGVGQNAVLTLALSIESWLPDLIDDIGTSSAAWAAERPTVTHSRGRDPKRLLFYRGLTAFMRARFHNRPHYLVVFALAHFFFDMRGQTVDSVKRAQRGVPKPREYSTI